MSSWSRSRLGYRKFVVSRSRYRLGHLKFVASRSRSRLGYLKFVASLSGRPLGYLKFVASWSRSLLGYLKFCGFAVTIPVGMPQVCGSGSRFASSFVAPSSRSRYFTIDTSSFVASRSRSRLGWSGSRLGYLKFCGFAVKVPIGIPPCLPCMMNQNRQPRGHV